MYCLLEYGLGVLCTVWQLDPHIALSECFEFATIGSGDGGVIDWAVIDECITVGTVMSTCATVDACTKLGIGNIESDCDFNIVRHAGCYTLTGSLSVRPCR